MTTRAWKREVTDARLGATGPRFRHARAVSIARSVVQRLEGAGKTVHVVHPFDASGTAFKSLRAVGQPIEVIDLIVNSFAGMKVVEQAVP